jgi:glycerol-3-phosphate acyltransferase PlsX
MKRIAIEATGCDEGYGEILKGARIGLEENNGLELVLVGGGDGVPDGIHSLGNGIKLELTKHTYDPEKGGVQRESSIYRAIKMLKNKEVDGVIAPGETGATVLCSVGLLKRINKVFLRPTIAAQLPYRNVLLDVGASYESKPEHLFQFAIMGKVFSEVYLGTKNPLISLINIGEELYKGPDFIKEAKKLIDKLREKGYNIFDRYFEPSSFGLEYLDAERVGVADGLVGNVMLKSLETGLTTGFGKFKEKTEDQNKIRQVCALIGNQNPVRELKQEFDYRSYATCPLLGVNGTVMICHGSSDAETIANAIRVTKKYLECDVNARLEEEILRCGALD